jgi:hypothetical protein
MPWIREQPWFFVTQVSTGVTWVWEWSTPIMFLWLWYRATANCPGRLRFLSNRYGFVWLWLALGGVFHVGIHATLELGIFPWAMMATYVAFLRPQTITAWANSRGSVAHS